MPVSIQPNLNDCRLARKLFLQNEPRDLFYRVACELVDLAFKGKMKIKLSEAIAL